MLAARKELDIEFQPNGGGQVDTTSYTYNDLGQQTSVTDPDGDATSYTYNALGTQTSETDADGNLTTFVYDNLGRLITETSATGGVTSYTYDNAGQQTTVTDPDDQVTAYTYDNLGRTVAESFYASAADYQNNPGNPEETLSWSYDSEGTLAISSDYYATTGDLEDTSYSYDALGRVTEESGSGDFGSGGLAYTYDANGNVLTEVDDGTGTTITYSGYNGLNLPASETVSGSGLTTLSIAYTYSTIGQVLQTQEYQGGALVDTLVNQYDGDGNLTVETETDPSGNVLDSFGYLINGEEQVVAFDRNGADTYTYDAAGQLTSATYPNTPWANESYTYDAAGNRETTTTGTATTDTLQTTTSTTTTGNQLQSDGTFIYSYDADGNLVAKTRISDAYAPDARTIYTYDNAGRLTEATTEDNGDTITQNIVYSYNSLGERVGETVTVGGTTTVTKFAYDLAGNVAATFDGDNNLTGTYVYGQAVDQLLAQEDGSGNVNWMMTDRDQSIRDVVQYNGTSSVVDHVDYNSYGVTIDETNPSAAHLTGYAGYINDLALGMLETQSRIYNPSTGEFISQDPSGFSGSPNGNLYEYAGNSPIDMVDPSGLSQEDPVESINLGIATQAVLPSLTADPQFVQDVLGDPLPENALDDDYVPPASIASTASAAPAPDNDDDVEAARAALQQEIVQTGESAAPAAQVAAAGGQAEPDGEDEEVEAARNSLQQEILQTGQGNGQASPAAQVAAAAEQDELESDDEDVETARAALQQEIMQTGQGNSPTSPARGAEGGAVGEGDQAESAAGGEGAQQSGQQPKLLAPAVIVTDLTPTGDAFRLSFQIGPAFNGVESPAQAVQILNVFYPDASIPRLYISGHGYTLTTVDSNDNTVSVQSGVNASTPFIASNFDSAQTALIQQKLAPGAAIVLLSCNTGGTSAGVSMAQQFNVPVAANTGTVAGNIGTGVWQVAWPDGQVRYYQTPTGAPPIVIPSSAPPSSSNPNPGDPIKTK